MYRAITYFSSGQEFEYFEDESFRSVYKAALNSLKNDKFLGAVRIFKWSGNYNTVASIIAKPVTSEIKDFFLRRPDDKRFKFLGSYMIEGWRQ